MIIAIFVFAMFDVAEDADVPQLLLPLRPLLPLQLPRHIIGARLRQKLCPLISGSYEVLISHYLLISSCRQSSVESRVDWRQYLRIRIVIVVVGGVFQLIS